MNTDYNSYIEAYLSGQMSSEEVSKFESMLEVNPELKQELAWQAEVIQGIGNFRKAELKARLDALDTSIAWWSIAQLAPIGQFLGGTMIAGLLALGGYWIADNSETAMATVESETLKRESDVKIPVPDYQIPDDQKSAFLNEKIKLYQDSISRPSVKKSTTEKEMKLEPSEETNMKEDLAFTPIVIVPTVEDVKLDKTFVPASLPTPDKIERQPEKKVIDVEIVTSRSSKIKYKYYEGKLYLYGKFKDEPYQILEINSTSGRRIYLSYKNLFYKIEYTDKLLPLESITDRRLIQELRIL